MDTSRLILGRKSQLQPARPPRRHGENGERDMTQLGKDFLLEVSEAMGVG